MGDLRVPAPQGSPPLSGWVSCWRVCAPRFSRRSVVGAAGAVPQSPVPRGAGSRECPQRNCVLDSEDRKSRSQAERRSLDSLVSASVTSRVTSGAIAIGGAAKREAVGGRQAVHSRCPVGASLRPHSGDPCGARAGSAGHTTSFFQNIFLLLDVLGRHWLARITSIPGLTLVKNPHDSTTATEQMAPLGSGQRTRTDRHSSPETGTRPADTWKSSTPFAVGEIKPKPPPIRPKPPPTCQSSCCQHHQEEPNRFKPSHPLGPQRGMQCGPRVALSAVPLGLVWGVVKTPKLALFSF